MPPKTTKDVAKQRGVKRRRAQQLVKAGKAGSASKPGGHDWIISGTGSGGKKKKTKKRKKSK